MGCDGHSKNGKRCKWRHAPHVVGSLHFCKYHVPLDVCKTDENVPLQLELSICSMAIEGRNLLIDTKTTRLSATFSAIAVDGQKLILTLC